MWVLNLSRLWLSADKNDVLKNMLKDRLATLIWPTRKRSLYFTFPWRCVPVDSSSDRDRRVEMPEAQRELPHRYMRFCGGGGEGRASKNEREWGRQKETKFSSCQREARSNLGGYWGRTCRFQETFARRNEGLRMVNRYLTSLTSYGKNLRPMWSSFEFKKASIREQCLVVKNRSVGIWRVRGTSRIRM